MSVFKSKVPKSRYPKKKKEKKKRSTLKQANKNMFFIYTLSSCIVKPVEIGILSKPIDRKLKIIVKEAGR
jgi:hypothetical protein